MEWARRPGEALQYDDALALILKAFWQGKFLDDQIGYKPQAFSNSKLCDAATFAETFCDAVMNKVLKDEFPSLKHEPLSFVPEGDSSRFAVFEILCAVNDPEAKALLDGAFDWETRFSTLAGTPISRHGEEGQIILKDMIFLTRSGLIDWLELRGYGEVRRWLLGDGETEIAAPDETASQEEPEEKETVSQDISSPDGGSHEGTATVDRDCETAAPDSEGGSPAPPPKKRGGGPKRGPYYGPLKRHLKWRKDNRDDLETASLGDLRKEARNRLTTDKVKGMPRSRSGFEDALKAALSDLGVNR